MTRRLRAPLILLAVAGPATLGGCSGPFVSPIAPPPYRDEAPAPYDATWKALIRSLAMENVPLRTVAKDSGVISSDDFVSPIGVYADCGRLGDVPIEGEALVAFTLFVQPNRGATEIQINAKMQTRAYRRGGSGGVRSGPVFRGGSPRRRGAHPVGTA